MVGCRTGSEKREHRKLGTGHDGPATAPALRLRRSLALLLFPPLSFVPLAHSVSLPSPTSSVSLLLSASPSPSPSRSVSLTLTAPYASTSLLLHNPLRHPLCSLFSDLYYPSDSRSSPSPSPRSILLPPQTQFPSLFRQPLHPSRFLDASFLIGIGVRVFERKARPSRVTSS